MTNSNASNSASKKTFFFFVKEKGGIRIARSNREKKKKKTDPVTNYDKAFLYHLYCMSGGKVSEMAKYLQQLPPEQQKAFPSDKTIYRLSKKENWPDRFAEFQAMLRTRMESEDAMTYERMNKAAGHVLGLFLLRMAGLAQKFNQPNADKAKIPISSKDLKYLWEMMRTEKGLPQNITRTSIHDSREDGLDDVIAKEAGQDFLNQLETLDGDQVADIISGARADDDIPEFIK